MSDPLVRLYKDSLSARGAKTKIYAPLSGSELEIASDRIQKTGQHPGTPTPIPVHLAKLSMPKGWSSVPDVPVTPEQQQFMLKRLENERLRAVFAPPPQKPPTVWMPPKTLEEQRDFVEQSTKELIKKTMDEVLRAKQVEYDALFDLYKEMVDNEYEEIRNSSARAAFLEFQERGGFQLYRDLRPSYYSAGVKEPHKFIMQMTATARLAGRPVQQGVHPVFARILDRVEKRIKDSKVNTSSAAYPDALPVKYVGCFRPSLLGSGEISNHMIGAAIDIDSKSNPHLKANQITVLDKMLTFWAADEFRRTQVQSEALRVSGSWLKEVPKFDQADAVEVARKFYDKTNAISQQTKAFLELYMQDWIETKKKRVTPIEQWKQDAFQILDEMSKAFGGIKKLAIIQARGFLSIPGEVFEALITDEDLQWGLYTTIHAKDPKKGGLDSMHFEVKPHVRDAILGRSRRRGRRK